jgi:hypothetical protein
MKYFANFVPDHSGLSSQLIFTSNWSDKDFSNAQKFVRSSEPGIDSRKGNLKELRDFLKTRRTFLLTLLENPNLLEHDSFTELLWAVFHLTEELSVRDNIEELPATDYKHLSGDIKRAYLQLITEWLEYMKHLKKDYPYLFSLAVRTNPWDVNASPIVK